MKVYAGIDLHSSNNYLGIIDEEDKRIYRHKLSNDLREVLNALEPFEEEIEGVVVESTFNWYWLVDGLMGHGYRVHLASPSAIKQYEGLKHVDDVHESFFLAKLLRLGILPEGYIYPKEERPVRDLLRKRLQLVRHRTAHILSAQNIITRNTGKKMGSRDVKKLDEEWVRDFLGEEHLSLSVNSSVGVIRYLTDRIKQIERVVEDEVELRKEFEYVEIKK